MKQNIQDKKLRRPAIIAEPPDYHLYIKKQIDRLKGCLKTVDEVWENLKPQHSNEELAKARHADGKAHCEKEKTWDFFTNRLLEKRDKLLGQVYTNLIEVIHDQAGMDAIDKFSFPSDWWDELG